MTSHPHRSDAPEPVFLGGEGWPLTRFSDPLLILCADPARSQEALALIRSGEIDPDAPLTASGNTRIAPIRAAALNGSWLTLDALLARSKSPLSPDAAVSAIHCSTLGALRHFSGCEVAFERLASLGADFSRPCARHGGPPLGVALREPAYQPFAFETLSLLLRLGADPNGTFVSTDTRSLLFQAFFIASDLLDTRYARALLAAGANPLAPEPDGARSIAHALAYGCPSPRLGAPLAPLDDACRLLEGALDRPGGLELLSFRDERDNTPLESARACGSLCLAWLEALPQRLAALADARAIGEGIGAPAGDRLAFRI